MKKLGLYVALGLSLSACATGINNGASTVKVNQADKVVTHYPVEAAILNIYTKKSSDTLYTVVDSQQVIVEFEVIPKGKMVFNNKQVQSAETTSRTMLNGEIIDESVGINYFTLAPLVFHGFTSDSDEYSLATQTANIPKTAKVGDSSIFVTENVYSDSSKDTQVSSYTQAWSLSQASNNTAWLCINSSENMLLDYDLDGTMAECYKINAKGDILDSKIDNVYPTEDGTETLSFKRK